MRDKLKVSSERKAIRFQTNSQSFKCEKKINFTLTEGDFDKLRDQVSGK